MTTLFIALSASVLMVIACVILDPRPARASKRPTRTARRE
jgi:hypothetical protein